MKLEIDRSKWLRGEGGTRSVLYRESDGKMCCLGFYALALGASQKDICQVSEPQESTACVPWPEWALIDLPLSGPANSPETTALMTMNDHMQLLDGDRERAIAAIFARHGVEVTFVGPIDDGAVR